MQLDSKTQASQTVVQCNPLQKLLSQKNALQSLLEQLDRSEDPVFTRLLEEEFMEVEEQFRRTLHEVGKLKTPLGRRIMLFLLGKSRPRPERWSERRNSSAHIRLQPLLANTIRDPERRASLGALSGDDAQHTVDYLNVILHEHDILACEEGRYALSLLCKLAKSAGIYPKCYLPKGVARSPDPVAGGSFADIYKGRHEKHTVCLKVPRIFGSQENAQFLEAHAKEIALWPHLSHHPNILPFYGVYLLSKPKQRACLVSPWMENGNLRTYLKKHPETPRIPLLLDIINGLAFLHNNCIVHGDLKAENILVSDEGRALIADFGLSHIQTGSGLTSIKSPTGTLRWTAPEVFSGSPPTWESDIWSFACLCYEVLTGEIPFHEYDDRTMVAVLSRGFEVPTRPSSENCHGDVDDKIWDIMTRCWDYEVQSRPTCKVIQECIVGLQARDTRPEASTHMWDIAVKFRRAMMRKLGTRVDYERVEEILLGIQNEVYDVPT